MKDQEAFFDAEIAPELKRLAELCGARLMALGEAMRSVCFDQVDSLEPTR